MTRASALPGRPRAPRRPFTAARRRILSAALAVLVAVAGPAMAASAASAAPAAGPARLSGYATHDSLGPDGRTTNGNCSLPAIPKDRLYVAVGPDLYAGGAGCGSYLDVTGPHGTVRVEVADSCHECVHGHLDLSEEAFRAIGDYDAGIITTSYVPVAASTVPPLSFRFKDGSSAYWAALQVLDAGVRLRSVELWVGARWVPLSLTDYGYWLAPGYVGAGPFTVRVTDTTGRTATVQGIGLDPMRLQHTASRLR